MKNRVAPGVIERLPSYLNCLLQLRAEGAKIVSSARLSEMTKINSAQIRRDLTRFGTFGRRGRGYEVELLLATIQHILGADHAHGIALVGAGNLGSAIANYSGLSKHGFVVSAVFDNSPAKVGTRVGGVEIRHVDEMEMTVRDLQISMAIIAVPPEAAQRVADTLVRAGVKVIVNYTPAVVSVPKHIRLHNTDPVKELLYTLYYLSRRNQPAEP